MRFWRGLVLPPENGPNRRAVCFGEASSKQSIGVLRGFPIASEDSTTMGVLVGKNPILPSEEPGILYKISPTYKKKTIS